MSSVIVPALKCLSMLLCAYVVILFYSVLKLFTGFDVAALIV